MGILFCARRLVKGLGWERAGVPKVLREGRGKRAWREELFGGMEWMERRVLLSGVPTHLVFLQQPTDVVAGEKISQVRVAVEDSSGNIVTDSDANITISAPNSTHLTGTLKEQVVNGVATFDDLSIDLAAYPWQLVAGTPGPLLVSSNSFRVLPAAPAALRYVTRSAISTLAGQAFLLDFGLNDRFGNFVTHSTDGETISLLSGPEGAVLGGTLQVNASFGDIRFTDLALTKAGTYRFHIEDENGFGLDTGDFIVEADSLHPHMVLPEQASGTFGVKSLNSLSIDIQDPYENLIVADHSTVTVSLNGRPDGASLLGTTTLVVVNGVATFSDLSVTAYGGYNLEFSDVETDSVFTDSFLILAEPIHFAFDIQPTDTIAGETLGPAVTLKIEDQDGKVVTGIFFPVHLSIFDGPSGGVLGGTLGWNTLDGVVTFNDLSFTTAGRYQLIASGFGLTSVTTTPFEVIPELASEHLVVTDQGGTVPMGESSSAAAVDLAMEDRFGNLILAGSSKITVSLLNGPAGGKISGATKVVMNGGTATLGGLVYSLPGTYHVRASAGADFVDFTQVVGAASTLVPIPKVAADGYALGTGIHLATTLKSIAGGGFGGTATIEDSDHIVLGSATVAANGTVKWVLNGLGVGGHVCTVHFGGDVNHAAGSSGNFTILVNAASTTTMLTSSGSALSFGQGVTLTANVGASGGIARTGMVVFKDNGVVVGQEALDGSSRATLTLNQPMVGVHAYTAIYMGDGNFKGAVAGLSKVTVKKDVVVGQPLSGGARLVAVGESVELSGTFVVSAPGIGVPGGLATFKDGSKIIGTAALDGGGVARLTTSFKTAGKHKITVSYGGSATSDAAAPRVTILVSAT